MAVTLQTNIDLKGMAEKLKALDSFVICGHISPDGDCIGSQLALGHALRSLGKQVQFILARNDKIDINLEFLPGIEELIPAAEYQETADAFIACDVPTVERIGDASKVKERCVNTFTVDHHANPSVMSDWNYVDPDAASTTLIVWDLIKALEVEPDNTMALCAYTGLTTDTGGFRFQNTDAAAFQAAAEMVSAGIDPSAVAREVFQCRTTASLQLESLALERMMISDDDSYVISYLLLADFERFGAEKADAEPIINTLRSIKGIRVACMLREQEKSVRGSFRAKDDTDVAELARKYDGGGHKAAAGFTVYADMEHSITRVKRTLTEALSKGA